MVKLYLRLLGGLTILKRKLFKRFGLMTKGEFKQLKREVMSQTMEDKRIIVSLSSENTNLRTKIAKLPFEFDELLENYSINQTNALIYKIVHNTRSQPENVHYLERWEKRCREARLSLEEIEK